MKTELLELLENYGGHEGMLDQLDELGVSTVQDLLQVDLEDFLAMGMKKVRVKNMLDEIRRATEEKEELGNEALKQVMTIPLDDDSLLEQIKKKNELRVNQQSYIAAIRADLANRAGLLDVTGKLTEAMESFALSNDAPVDNLYLEVQTLITQRDYAEIFAAMPKGSRSMVNKKRKQELLKRMQEYFWPAVFSAFLEIQHWQQIWISSITPGAAMAFFSGRTDIVPPGVGMAPDTSSLKGAAERLRGAMNKTLAGLNSMAADALLYDCVKVKQILLTEKLPGAVGAVDYDQMLTRLEINIDPSYIQTEQNLVRFVLGMMQVEDIRPEEEASYFAALFTLGSQINWRLIGFRTEDLVILEREVPKIETVLPMVGELEDRERVNSPKKTEGSTIPAVADIPRLGVEH